MWRLLALSGAGKACSRRLLSASHPARPQARAPSGGCILIATLVIGALAVAALGIAADARAADERFLLGVHDGRAYRLFAAPYHAVGGEVGEILALVREARRAQGAEGARVVAGLSAAGYMAVNLACAAPDLVAGVGVTAAGPFRCAENAMSAVARMRGERLDGTAAATRCAAVTGKTPAVRASLWHGEADSRFLVDE